MLSHAVSGCCYEVVCCSYRGVQPRTTRPHEQTKLLVSTPSRSTARAKANPRQKGKYVPHANPTPVGTEVDSNLSSSVAPFCPPSFCTPSNVSSACTRSRPQQPKGMPRLVQARQRSQQPVRLRTTTALLDWTLEPAPGKVGQPALPRRQHHWPSPSLLQYHDGTLSKGRRNQRSCVSEGMNRSQLERAVYQP